jgi:YtkA-like
MRESYVRHALRMVATGFTLAALSLALALPAGAQTKPKSKMAGPDIMLMQPTAPKTGDNQFEVMVKGADGEPVNDADVSVTLVMPKTGFTSSSLSGIGPCCFPSPSALSARRSTSCGVGDTGSIPYARLRFGGITDCVDGSGRQTAAEHYFWIDGVHRAGLFAGPLSRYTSWQLAHASASVFVASDTFS